MVFFSCTFYIMAEVWLRRILALFCIEAESVTWWTIGLDRRTDRDP